MSFTSRAASMASYCLFASTTAWCKLPFITELLETSANWRSFSRSFSFNAGIYRKEVKALSSMSRMALLTSLHALTTCDTISTSSGRLPLSCHARNAARISSLSNFFASLFSADAHNVLKLQMSWLSRYKKKMNYFTVLTLIAHTLTSISWRCRCNSVLLFANSLLLAINCCAESFNSAFNFWLIISHSLNFSRVSSLLTWILFLQMTFL